MVQAKPLEVEPLWRNPDVAEADRGFRLKKSQYAPHKQLPVYNMYVLSPRTCQQSTRHTHSHTPITGRGTVAERGGRGDWDPQQVD